MKSFHLPQTSIFRFFFLYYNMKLKLWDVKFANNKVTKTNQTLFFKDNFLLLLLLFIKESCYWVVTYVKSVGPKYIFILFIYLQLNGSDVEEVEH